MAKAGILTFGMASLMVAIVGGVAAQRSASDTGRHDLVGKRFEAVVSRVGDGDTLDATPVGEKRPIRIRLEGIDAPEQGEVFGREALGLLRTLVFNQRVRITGRELDRYGRLIARVARDGTDASAHLIRAGLACHSYAYDAALAREEAQARTGGAGFWATAANKPACVTTTAFSARPKTGATPPPLPPALESAARAPTGTAFRGNVESRLYHAPHCRNYTCRNCTQVFASGADARAAGFRPAGDCLKP